MIAAFPVFALARPEIPFDHHYEPSVVTVPSTEFLPAVKMPELFRPLPPRLLAALEQEPELEYGPPKPEYGPPPPPRPVYGPPTTLQKLVTKSIYVHLPPPDNEPLPAQQVFEKPVPKKHYQIVFIKTPTPPKQVAPTIPEPAEDEHKTLVYVLVKKPDPPAKIEVPKARPTQPSKPEVVFIKYKENAEKPPTEYGPPPGPY